MGYESKFYFVRRYDFKSWCSDYNASCVLAMVDTSKLGYDDYAMAIRNAFDKDIDFTIYVPTFDEDKDKYRIEDCYGEHLKYASNKGKLLAAIGSYMLHIDLEFPEVVMLNALVNSVLEDDDIYIVHFGY